MISRRSHSAPRYDGAQPRVTELGAKPVAPRALGAIEGGVGGLDDLVGRGLASVGSGHPDRDRDRHLLLAAGRQGNRRLLARSALRADDEGGGSQLGAGLIQDRSGFFPRL